MKVLSLGKISSILSRYLELTETLAPRNEMKMAEEPQYAPNEVSENKEASEETEATTEPEETEDSLTQLEVDVLSIEKKRWRYQGSKEQAILKQLGINATRYYQILNALIDDPRALKADPHLIKSLQAKRDLY